MMVLDAATTSTTSVGGKDDADEDKAAISKDSKQVFLEGMAAGFCNGYKRGLVEGYAKGYDAGFEEGYGEAKAMADMYSEP